MRQSNTDSLTNCLASNPLAAPTTLRIPTSLARSAERAVVRFTKLMQAISRMKMATTENTYTLLMLPFSATSRSERKCTSSSGSRKSLYDIFDSCMSLPARRSR
ncbi:hypothetical protein D3C87_1870250 [compost metagenome]